jgi:ferredoxin
MATVITSECINCGACEPECPNTAIYQAGVQWELDGQMHAPISNDIFYIVPEKCTECVGFYDHEACAAVCPVDCCVPDPNIPETEAVLLERAKKLHPETTFGTDFPSRFRAEGGVPSEAPVAASTPPPPAPSAPAPAAPASAPQAAGPEPGNTLPTLDDWEIPIRCRACEGEYTVAFQYLRPGVVFYCPHCQASFVPTRTTYLEVASALEQFSRRWERAFTAFQEKRRQELEEFEERQRSELAEFEQRLREFTRAGQAATGTARRRWFS